MIHNNKQYTNDCFFLYLNTVPSGEVLGSYQNRVERTGNSPNPFAHIHKASPSINILHQNGAFVTINECAST